MIILEKMSNWLNLCAQYLCLTLMVFLIIIMPLEVFFRYVLNSSLIWSNELLGPVLAWLTFSGASVAFKNKSHFSITYFVSKYVSEKKQTYVSIFVDFLIIVFYIIVFIGGIIVVKFSLHQSLMTLPGKWYMIYLIISITSFIILIHTIVDIFSIHSNLTKRN